MTQMEIKKYFSFLLLLIAVSISLPSCSNDDKDEPKTGLSQIIIGEWNSEFFGEASDFKISDLNINDTEIGSVDSRLVFGSNGKGYEIDQYDGTKTDFSYTIEGQTLKMTAGNVSQIHKVIKYGNNVVYSIMESEQIIFKMVRVK